MLLLDGRKFNPLSIPGLGLWLRGDVAYTSISPDVQAANGESIRRWPDMSGNGRHADQGTGGNKPTWSASGMNGRPGLATDGIDDFLLISTGLGLLRNVAGATVFIVAKGTAATPGATQGEIQINTGGGAARVTASRTTAGTYSFGGRRLDGDSFVSQTGGTTGTAAYIHTLLFEYSAARATEYVNGALVGTIDPFQTAGSTSDTDSTAITVGAGAGGSSPYAGILGELLVWPRRLSTSERNYVHRYLGKNFSISTQ